MREKRCVVVTMVVEFNEENHIDEHDFVGVYTDIIQEAGNKVIALTYGNATYAGVLSADEAGKPAGTQRWSTTD